MIFGFFRYWSNKFRRLIKESSVVLRVKVLNKLIKSMLVLSITISVVLVFIVGASFY